MTKETYINRKTTIVLFVLAIFVGLSIGIILDLDLEDRELIENEENNVENQEEVDNYEPEITHEQEVINTVEEAIKSVVSIELKESVSGSGFLVSSEGYIITNRHVAEAEGDYKVITNEGEEYDAEVVSRDSVRDLAFLKIEGDDFEALKLGDSDGLRLGQTAIAIGYSLGELKNSVSVGVVSGLVRDIWAREGWSLEKLEGVIQTDAAINLGNSGGPLLNLKGEVIGINTAKDVDADNVGFAIPINQAKKAIESVLEHGEIIKPYLGVRYVMIDEYEMEMRGLPIDYGALIVRGGPDEAAIDPESPANVAGLREGDIITALNGEEINSENPLYEAILEYKPGETVEVEYMRGERKEKTEIELAERPSD
ncbi:MAG: S1C family serine protease [Patescibacteria group bacterium]